MGDLCHKSSQGLPWTYGLSTVLPGSQEGLVASLGTTKAVLVPGCCICSWKGLQRPGSFC